MLNLISNTHQEALTGHQHGKIEKLTGLIRLRLIIDSNGKRKIQHLNTKLTFTLYILLCLLHSSLSSYKNNSIQQHSYIVPKQCNMKVTILQFVHLNNYFNSNSVY
jgi:hypothetical protein